MAEPTNTPLPTAPPTPRSTSPAPALPSSSSSSHNNNNNHNHNLSHSSSTTLSSPTLSTKSLPLRTATATAAQAQAPAPAPAIPPVPGGPVGSKPVVLHIGDPIRYNPETYAEFATQFEVVRPATGERQRDEFVRALRERRWGDFAAVFRPFWATGGEMGQWDAELIGLLPASVRVFASAGAGFDWADTRLLAERGIIYCNGGLAAAESVADFACAMIISTFRHLPYCIASASSSSASPSTFQTCHAAATSRSHTLRGRALGIVGLGNVGQQVAQRMGLGFGMEILYYDVVAVGAPAAAAAGGVEARRCDTLEVLVRASDCVVLCAPAGAGRLVDAACLGWFRPGARLVNVARGTLVDEEAVADALEEGRLAGVAFDVHADEPAVNERLRRMAGDRALLTCHNAGGTVETHAGFEELAMRNIMRVLGGQQAITPVNLQWLKGVK
ncbi:hypothetical protein F4778DRAFT_5136 [Xylariomycetidae sp. FL2044]|nr:hypothetical protein F4778DRAFT_5136 [Xylariomycetidae sp. FL2044]